MYVLVCSVDDITLDEQSELMSHDFWQLCTCLHKHTHKCMYALIIRTIGIIFARNIYEYMYIYMYRYVCMCVCTYVYALCMCIYIYINIHV